MSTYADPSNLAAIRLFEELDYTWSIDGLDREGRYTETCWNFDTKEAAMAAVDEFRVAIGSSTDRVLVWPDEFETALEDAVNMAPGHPPRGADT
jgi:hypothetical protein